MKSKNYILVRAAVTLLLTLLSSTGAWADDAKIIVWLNDGNKSEVLFADMPELTYADGYVSITSNSPSHRESAEADLREHQHRHPRRQGYWSRPAFREVRCLRPQR